MKTSHPFRLIIRGLREELVQGTGGWLLSSKDRAIHSGLVRKLIIAQGCPPRKALKPGPYIFEIGLANYVY